MEFILGALLIVTGLLISWGGLSGNLPNMIRALA